MGRFDIQRDLARFGPQATSGGAVLTLPDAQRYCRQVTLGHYENFPVVSWLLPRDLQQPFFNVYAFCRWADDLGDELPTRDEATAHLNWFRGELARCYAGVATHPVFVALMPTIAEFDLPEQTFADLIDAFLQDQWLLQYETFDQLRDYCRRSADPVGRLVLKLFRQHREEWLDWSDAICTGLQLANFWQDVGRDHGLGRRYLPLADCLHFGYSQADWQDRRTTPAFLSLMEFQVQRAREWLLRGSPLINHLPADVRLDVALFQQGGLAILEAVAAGRYRVWDRRPKLSKWKFAALFLATWWRLRISPPERSSSATLHDMTPAGSR